MGVVWLVVLVATIGLGKHLSPTRSNGLAALLDFIRQRARDSVGA